MIMPAISPSRLVLVFLAVFPGFLFTAGAAPRPNVVLIMADDMGFECVAANGGESYKTPRLDAMAAEGIRFEHCHSQPICTPSRVQIMTGIYNNRNYVRFGLLDPKEKTFGNLFKDAGYKTAIGGKWQLLGGREGPAHFGFDESCLWQVDRRPPRYGNPGLEINGKQVDFTNGEYSADIISDFLCDFIGRNKEEPFLVYYPMVLPHWPFQPTPDSEAWNPKESRDYPRNEWKDEWFADMVSYTDKTVGKIIDKLEAEGLRENTLVIFTGDNGTYVNIISQFKGGDYKGGKGSPKDNGTHVPLIVNWPGTTPKGRVSQSLVDFSDMLPTIAEVAGIKVPAKWGADGLSFSSEIKGGAASPRESIYCWYERNGKRPEATQHVRNQKFKLYSGGKLYNVIDDFSEKSPLDPDSLAEADRVVYEKLKTTLARYEAVTTKADPIQITRQKETRQSKK